MVTIGRLAATDYRRALDRVEEVITGIVLNMGKTKDNERLEALATRLRNIDDVRVILNYYNDGE